MRAPLQVSIALLGILPVQTAAAYPLPLVMQLAWLIVPHRLSYSELRDQADLPEEDMPQKRLKSCRLLNPQWHARQRFVHIDVPAEHSLLIAQLYE
ncbi:hypothetical protein D9M71_660930 [compost metagenome]